MGKPWTLLAFLLFFLANWHMGTTLNNTGNLTNYEIEEKLIEKLLVNSEVRKLILPLIDNGPVQLKIDSTVHQIAQVDELRQGIRINVWFKQYWNNPHLRWSLKEYPNIEKVFLNKNDIWIPDTCLYNKLVIEQQVDTLYRRLHTNVIVDHLGNCSWLSPAALFAQCSIDVTKFPFDEHVCSLVFGSWTYEDGQLDINFVKKNDDLSFFLVHSQWDLLDAVFERRVTVYSLNRSFPDVRLELRIKRLPRYHVLTTIIPCALIAFLSFITFVLPTNHGERVALVITVLLAMSVYMLIVSSILPQSSLSIPNICLFFLSIIVEIAVCLLATCVTIKIEGKETKVPVWVDVIVNKCLGILFDSWMERRQQASEVNLGYGDFSSELSKITGSTTTGHAQPKAIGNGDPNKKEGATEKLHSELLVIANHIREQNAQKSRIREWKKVAAVLDRFFIVFFPIVFTITCVVFFK